MVPVVGTQINKTHPQARGLIAYWNIAEGDGVTLNDVSGNNNVATFGSDRLARWKGSLFGRGLSFNRTQTQVVDILTPSSQLAGLTGECTVSAWFKLTSVGDYRYIFCDYNSGGTAALFALQFTNTNKFTFFWAGGGVQYPNPFTAASTTSGVADVWYHVVGVRRGSSGAWFSDIYVNGQRENSTSTAGNPATAGKPAIGGPGNYVSVNLTMTGIVDEVRVYNRALNANDVMQLYSNPHADFIKPRNKVLTALSDIKGNFFLFFR